VIVEKETTPIAIQEPAQEAKTGDAPQEGATEERKGGERRGQNRDRPYKPKGDGQGRRPPREGGQAGRRDRP